MGYEVYITRATSHMETKEFPISIEEWRAVVDADDEIVLSPEDWYWMRDESGEVHRFRQWLFIPRGTFFSFSDGAVHIKSPDRATMAKMVALAAKLNAIVLDEDGGSRYGPDGAWVPAEPTQKTKRSWWSRLRF